MKPILLRLFVITIVSALYSSTYAQVGIGTETPSDKAVLELKAAPGKNQGFLMPRLTSEQRLAFASTLTAIEKGLMVFDTDTNKLYYWSGTAWAVIEDSVGTDSQTLTFTAPNLLISGGNSVNLSAINTDGQTLTYTPASGLLTISGGNNVTITGTLPGGTAGGDLTGTYPNPAIATNAIGSAEITDGSITSADITDLTIATADIANLAIATGKLADGAVTDLKVTSVAPAKITAGGATNNQILKWNGTNWTPQADADVQTLTYTAASGLLAISGGNNVTITGALPGGTAGGDLTGTYPNPAIATNAIGSAEITDGSITSADITDLTIATADIANLAIATGKLADGAVTDLKVTSVAPAKITAGGAANNQVLKWNGTNWIPQGDTDGQTLTYTAASGLLAISGGNNVTITGTAPGGTAGGDLSGTYPNPTVSRLQGRAVSTTTPATGQVLKWSGTAWAPDTDVTGGGGGVGGGGAAGQVPYWTSATDIGGRNTFVFDEKNSRVGVGTATPLGTLHVMGSQFVMYRTINDDYTVVPTDYTLVAANTGKPIQILLPEIDPANEGRVLIIRSLNSSPVRLVGFGGKERIQTDEDLVSTYDMGIGNGEFLTMTIVAMKDRWMVVSGIRSRVK